MSLYTVTKIATKWHVTHVSEGWFTPLGSYPTRSAAITSARLLAGRKGTVQVIKP